MKIVRHIDSWIEAGNLGKSIPPYRRTFLENGGLYLNDFHARLASCPRPDGLTIDLGIPGWQRPEDALKLYELAYFATDPILELGCFHGLSTTIMARAIADARTGTILTSVDNAFRNLITTWKNLRSRGLKAQVKLRLGDARKTCARLIRAKRRFGLIFVDDSHSYDSVVGVCRLLDDLLIDGGFCLFHDYNDVKNTEPDNPEYGVAQGVRDGLRPDTFEFYGIFGCSALFRKMAQPDVALRT